MILILMRFVLYVVSQGCQHVAVDALISVIDYLRMQACGSCRTDNS